jgi:hypothetical protein
LYYFPNRIRIIKSRRMRWGRYVALMVIEEDCISGFAGKAKRKEAIRKTYT